MQKIKLEPKFEYNLQPGVLDWSAHMRDHVDYRSLTDEQIEWLYENTIGRFVLDSYFIFFEKDGDAVAFKLRWL